MSENTALLWSLFATVAGVFICSFEVFPELNEVRREIFIFFYLFLYFYLFIFIL